MKKQTKKLAIVPILFMSTMIGFVLIPLSTIKAEEVKPGFLFMQDVNSETIKLSDRKFNKILEKSKQRLESSPLLEYLGLTPEEFRALRRNGTSIREYVEDKGLSIEKVKEFKETALKERLDAKLEDGVIDQEKYDEILNKLDEIVESHLDAQMPMRLFKH